MTLLLLRHGETVENATGRYQGQTPGHLSPRGLAEAEAVAPRVARWRPEAVACSDLERACRTARIVLSGLTPTPPVLFTPLLRERDMGRLTGLAIAANPIDESVETAAECAVRARAFLVMAAERYGSRRLLVVSHGYFLRVFQATAEGVDPDTVPHFANCELRELHVPMP